MLRSSIVAGALAVVGVVGWFVLGSDCDGKVVRNAWQCVRNAGFEPAFCNNLYESQERAISRAPATFASETACRSQFQNCESGKGGWIAKPTPFCVIRGSDGTVARVEPVV